VLAGIAGMGLGAAIAAFFGAKSDRSISIFLPFAGGVMLALVAFELVPEAVEYSGVLTTTIGVIVGVLLVLLLDKLVDRLSQERHAKANPDCDEEHESVSERLHPAGASTKESRLLRAGVIILFAIALHNIPIGIVMGAAGHFEVALTITIGLMLTLHNIPEGMAVAAPLIGGGLSRLKAILLALAAGSTTAIGALIGVTVGNVSPTVFSLALAITSGAMLYVVFVEIFPETIFGKRERTPILSAIAGIAVVAMMMFILSGAHIH